MSKKTFGTLMDIVIQAICAAADTIASARTEQVALFVSLVEERDKRAGTSNPLQTLVGLFGYVANIMRRADL